MVFDSGPAYSEAAEAELKTAVGIEPYGLNYEPASLSANPKPNLSTPYHEP